MATDDTFSGNTAAQGGTDLYVLSDSASGAGFSGGTATATLVNSILGQASTPAPDFVAVQIGTATVPRTLSGSSNNFVSNNTAAATYPGTASLPSVAVVNTSVTDPQLSTLANNGGPTQTMSLAGYQHRRPGPARTASPRPHHGPARLSASSRPARP